MSRRKLREHLFKLVYLYAFNPVEELGEQIDLYFEENTEISEEEREFLKKRCEQIAAKSEEIDHKLNEVARGWKTNRFASCDLAILRVAVFEMMFDETEQVPESVAINEAVELAKQYGGDESPSFVNGLLGEISKNRK